ncbi:calcium-binding protein [Oceanomicrobium pacificus]|uniref:Uncharacterized protein n=1 Tax=Oceanomicrobium pacificus TaxID=2692916 RepID=A0A6B0TJ33_9RHOB|nr:hypothetical protein [Oceanomicrobium pacificus]MXU64420.1 hypothetical protein [Oceanomicrobium pacificus]
MALQFTAGQTVFDDHTLLLEGANALGFARRGGSDYLIVGAGAVGALSVLERLADGSFVLKSEIPYSSDSGTRVLNDIATFSFGAALHVQVAGRRDDNSTTYRLEDDGSLTTLGQFGGVAAAIKWSELALSGSGTSTVLTVAQWGIAGLQRFTLDADGVPEHLDTRPDAAGPYLGDVTAMEVATLFGTEFLAVASALDSGLQLFALDGTGVPELRGSIAPGPDSPFGQPTALDLVDHGPRAFAILAAHGTDSLTVLRVSSGGKLNPADHLLDDLVTRFGAPSVLDHVTYQGRVLVVAGGADGGMTLLELSPLGDLFPHAVVIDDFDLALGGLSDMVLELRGSLLHIWVTSETEHGLTELRVDLSGLAAPIRGGTGNDVLHGSASDDFIFGHGHKDMIYGHGGDDMLVDGRGRDALWGGPGDDLFIFVPDGSIDRIHDFEIGRDRIDLSDYGLHGMGSVVIEDRPLGVSIWADGDLLRVDAAPGTDLTPGLFEADDFIFG